DAAVTLDRDGGGQCEHAVAGQPGDAAAAEARVEETPRGQPDDTERAVRELGPCNVHASLAIHCGRAEEAFLAETDFLFAVVAERRVKSSPDRQTQDQKAAALQTLEAGCDDDSAGAVDRELGSEQLVPVSDQDGATRPERGVRLAPRKQAIHGHGTVPDLPIAVEIVCRSGDDDL